MSLLLLLTLYLHAAETANVNASGPNAASTSQECDFMEPPSQCSPKSCDEDEPRASSCSKRLLALCLEDQRDLEDCHNKEGCGPGTLPKGYSARVTKRIEEVGKIALSGCLKSREDYAAASVIYLHSETTKYKPQSYLQAMTWARKAVELGDVCHRRYIAFGLRKYFGELKLKQNDFSLGVSSAGNCPCNSLHKGKPGISLEKQLACQSPVRDMNGKTCPIQFCKSDPNAIPKGSVPGIW
jgi:hypothetical protein